MSSSNSPCAACKCLRRKCTQECVFAPYFPPDQPQKFINVHKVFGASNVAKLLNDINAAQRDDAVNSLAYEAEYRLRDPIYGCVGLISLLQTKLKQIQHDLYTAKKELSTYIGPAAMFPILQSNYMQQQHPNNPSSSALLPYNMQPMMGFPPGMAAAHGGAQLVIRDPQQHQQQHPHPHQQQHQRQHPHPHQQHHQHQQMFEAQQIAAAAREQQEVLRSYEQQHQQQPPQQQELLSFNFGFDTAGPATANHPFNQMPAAGAGASGIVPSLSLGSFENVPYHHQMQQQQQQHQQQPSEHHHPHEPHQLQFQSQAMLQQQLQQQQQDTPQQPQRAQSDEGRCNIGPSC